MKVAVVTFDLCESSPCYKTIEEVLKEMGVNRRWLKSDDKLPANTFIGVLRGDYSASEVCEEILLFLEENERDVTKLYCLIFDDETGEFDEAGM